MSAKIHMYILQSTPIDNESFWLSVAGIKPRFLFKCYLKIVYKHDLHGLFCFF